MPLPRSGRPIDGDEPFIGASQFVPESRFAHAVPPFLRTPMPHIGLNRRASPESTAHFQVSNDRRKENMWVAEQSS